VDLLAVYAMAVLRRKRLVAAQPILHSTAVARAMNFLFKVLSLFSSFIGSCVGRLSFPIIMVVVGELVLMPLHMLLVVVRAHCDRLDILGSK
jgi:hypothetical protein